MSYIAPDSELQFFQNLNIDVDYENTIYFPTTIAKDTYFDNIPSIKCPSCTYQRERRGFCRVEVPISQMYGRSYMRFKNNQFENKWFYAFILSVVYINNITTEVEYQIDECMTWMGSYTIDQCFVERNHTETDNIGDNLVPEPFDTSMKVHNTMATTGHFTGWDVLIVFIAKYEQGSQQLPSESSFGFYTGLSYVIRSASNVTNYIYSLPSDAQERIVGLYAIPRDFVPNPPSARAPISYQLGINGPVAGVTLLDGYGPAKNNKLYTYPYYNLVVQSTEGSQKEFLFELAKDLNGNIASGITFELRGIVGELTQVALIPRGYNTPDYLDLNYTDAMYMTDFPMCGWNVDTYKAYLAQQMIQLPANLANTALATAAATAVGGPAAGFGVGAAEAAGNLVNLITGAIKAHRIPIEYKGKDAPQLGLTVGSEYKDFYIYKDSVRGYQAKIIDDYFTMFGYAINEVTQPKINVRPYYTYVKTIGCHINGSFPEDSKRVIEQCFNRGIRFWKEDHTHIGDYTVNNAPTP